MKRKKKPEAPKCKECKGMLIARGLVYAFPQQEQKFVCKSCGDTTYKNYRKWSR